MNTDLKRWITNRALELGFIKVGFTHAEPLSEVATYLSEQVSRGRTTPFEESDIALRTNPKRVWPPCKTLVVLAFPLPLSNEPHKGEGFLARSAVGRDYHTVLRGKLETLVSELVSIHPFEHTPVYQVDTGPLNERGLATRAGVGWIGRNQQLIVPGYGSFVALALLLLDVEIPADTSLANHCGKCTECITACPAQILGDTSFNPLDCLSYLTQQKDVIPLEKRSMLQGRIFGCDTCQEACPHNQKRLAKEREGTHELHRGVNLEEILNLTKGEFNRKYKVTAAGWRGKGILQRNAFLELKKNASDGTNNDLIEKWMSERQKKDGIPPIIRPYLEKPKKA